ncbi:RNA polymerase sigma factor SigJ [Micromonospora matsumotoense]|uniref:RNA polymerase sigma factor SigJ n=1 Tax=Micromonospora matsumotoense TaxID=121616 RepID=UPI0033C778D3
MPEETVPWHAESPDPAEAIRERSVLLKLSYRLLGSLADAEDAVQETYIRWHRLSDEGRDNITNPRAWLIRTASRIGLDMLKTARARRERYVGEWLPEPVPVANGWSSQEASTVVDPADRVSLDDSVSMALLVVLETMTPAERVAFVLHDVFRYTYPEIADVVGRTPAACRQLASSARRRVRAERRTPVRPAEHAAAVRAFRSAWQAGDLAALVEALDPDATAIIDGGGLVSATLAPLHGPAAIASFFLGVWDRQPDLAVGEEIVNGEPGLIATDRQGRTLAVLALATTDTGRISHVWVVRNPRKLDAWRWSPTAPDR